MNITKPIIATMLLGLGGFTAGLVLPKAAAAPVGPVPPETATAVMPDPPALPGALLAEARTRMVNFATYFEIRVELTIIKHEQEENQLQVMERRGGIKTDAELRTIQAMRYRVALMSEVVKPFQSEDYAKSLNRMSDLLNKEGPLAAADADRAIEDGKRLTDLFKVVRALRSSFLAGQALKSDLQRWVESADEFATIVRLLERYRVRVCR